MNLLALLAGLLPWAATPVSAFTRVYAACSLLCIEVQVVTWLGRGTLGSLLPLNVLIAAVLIGWHVRSRRRAWQWVQRTRERLPVPVVIGLLIVVAATDLWRTVEAADPYQMERVMEIERTGTLAYSSALDPKANIIGGFYELILADVKSVPGLGPWLMQLHGVGGLLVFALAVAAVQTWLPLESAWTRTLLFVVPVVFNQLVLVKNDLFIGAPALVALAWAIGATGRDPRDVWWAGWLTGLVVAGKLTNAAVALVVGVSVLFRYRHWRPVLTLGAGILTGIIAAGFLLTLWQNARWYGDPLATAQVEALGGFNQGIDGVAVGAGRFLISLVDLGVVTRALWPGRGGWGGTFGLPFIWAVVILLACARSQPVARRALLAGLLSLFALGVTFPDADLSHRLVIGPGLLIIVAAASVARALDRRLVTQTLAVVVVLSALQILRSAVLYATTARGI
jgi:hypothetical protein